MGALSKKVEDCVPNNYTLRNRKRHQMYIVNGRTKEGYKKQPELFSVPDTYSNTRFK